MPISTAYNQNKVHAACMEAALNVPVSGAAGVITQLQEGKKGK